MPLLVGLGNPGPKYQDTRHNVGFALVDALVETREPGAWKAWGKSLLCRLSLGGQSLIAAKPQTFMNLSGEAVQALLAFHKLPATDMVVVADDAELPVGSIRIRSQGGHGGHNGLRNIVEHLGENFPRIRIGVGPRPAGWDLADFVLGKFGPPDREALKPAFEEFSGMVELGFAQGWERAASKFNKRAESPPL
jgi:PTH1 family peptidyl-tRNA hydrolase